MNFPNTISQNVKESIIFYQGDINTIAKKLEKAKENKFCIIKGLKKKK